MTPSPPASFQARFETTQGEFVVEVRPDWAPRGAERFRELASEGFYDDLRFFRVLDGFVAQFGIHGDPKTAAAWRTRRIQDDPVVASNRRGFVTFATAGPNTRTTQLFINTGDNAALDGMGFAPFAQIVLGMDVVDRLYAGYGEGAPRGRGPDQARIQLEGNVYLDRDFPQLDRLRKVTLIVAGDVTRAAAD